jgi:hypothetical protein
MWLISEHVALQERSSGVGGSLRASIPTLFLILLTLFTSWPSDQQLQIHTERPEAGIAIVIHAVQLIQKYA